MRLSKLFYVILIGLTACGRAGSPNTGTNPVGPTSYGTINGGGGVGIRCNGKLELLDVFEARQAGLTPLPSPGSQAEAVKLIATKFADHFWNIESIDKAEYVKLASEKVIEPVFEGRPFMNFGTGKEEPVRFVPSLPLSNDFGHYKIPSNCALEQIAYFTDSPTDLSIVKSKFDELDWLSKAVLVGHEFMYLIDRREGLGTLRNPKVGYTSEDSRRFIGRMFTVESLPTKTDQMPSADQIRRCSSMGTPDEIATYTYAFERTGTKTLSFVSNQIQGAASFYQMRADFEQVTLESFMDTEKGELDAWAPLKLTGLDRSPKLSLHVKKAKGQAPVLTVVDTSHAQSRVVGKPQSISCRD